MVTSGRKFRHVKNDPIRTELQKAREIYARKQKHDYSHVFRSKSRFDFIRLTCIMVGIELACAAEMAFVSPILLKIGIEHKHMTMVWGLSPIFGFFLSPFIGSLSDRCRSALGRRRPMILILGALIVLGLLLVPRGEKIGEFLGDPAYEDVRPDLIHGQFSAAEGNSELKYKWAVLVTIIGVILIDFGAETCQSPSRAYVLDISIPEDQTKGLSTFGIMSGLGSFFGFLLGTVNWDHTILGDFMGGNIPTVFTIVTIIFFFAIFCTVTSFKEIPLPILEQDEMLRPVSQACIKKEIERKKTTPLCLQAQEKQINGFSNHVTIETQIPDEEDESDEEDDKITFLQYLKSIIIMPKSIRVLCLTNLFSQMALLSFSLYFTDFVGEVVFKGDPASMFGSHEHNLYEEGIRFGCWGLTCFALSCVVYSFSIDKLITVIGAKVVYVGGLLIFALGMMCLATWPNKYNVILMSSAAGILYSTTFTVPFLILAQYHAKGSFKQKKGENVEMQKVRGLGTDVAILHSMLFVGQIIVALSSGSIISWIDSVSAVIYGASLFAVCSAVAASQILYMDI